MVYRHNVILTCHLTFRNNYSRAKVESSFRVLFHEEKQCMTASKLEKHISQALKKKNLNLDTKMPISERNFSLDSSITLWHFTEGREKRKWNRQLFNSKEQSYWWMWNFILVSTIHIHPVSLWKRNLGGNGLFCMHWYVHTSETSCYRHLNFKGAGFFPLH